MGQIDKFSEYGYRRCFVGSQPVMPDEVKDILTDLGYKFRHKVCVTSRPDRVRWDWVISWGPKADGDNWPIKKE
jgi:hypothetical protein